MVEEPLLSMQASMGGMQKSQESDHEAISAPAVGSESHLSSFKRVKLITKRIKWAYTSHDSVRSESWSVKEDGYLMQMIQILNGDPPGRLNWVRIAKLIGSPVTKALPSTV